MLNAVMLTVFYVYLLLCLMFNILTISITIINVAPSKMMLHAECCCADCLLCLFVVMPNVQHIDNQHNYNKSDTQLNDVIF